jgi:hypothetical protein
MQGYIIATFAVSGGFNDFSNEISLRKKTEALTKTYSRKGCRLFYLYRNINVKLQAFVGCFVIR